jgi:hypothetical protein
LALARTAAQARTYLVFGGVIYLVLFVAIANATDPKLTPAAHRYRSQPPVNCQHRRSAVSCHHLGRQPLAISHKSIRPL